MNSSVLLLAIPLFPLIGFLINGALGKKLEKNNVAIIACLMPAFSFACALALLNTPSFTKIYFSWIKTNIISIDFALRFDALSLVLVLVITGVGTLIHIYSVGYMKNDNGFSRYFAYLNLFTFLMLLLVLSDNLVLMFVGWEGVGLCSYLLIGFWHHEIHRADAAKKAFIVNRVGDLGFLLAVFLIFSQTGKFDFGSLSQSHLSPEILNIVCLLLFFGACGKSAQIPLYVWLPDAMAGPTPVSALIHAATMVTAGVYMIARLNFFFMGAEIALAIIGAICSITALMASIMACSENNLKKVLAYSTISQLAYMFCGLAVKSVATPVFHLTTHAFFKALLFLCAGMIIHGLAGEEDMRKMGGLRKKDKLAFITFLIGAIALCGVPPFSGFFSKEGIIVSAAEAQPIVGIILMATSLLTTFYIFRTIALVFFGAPKFEHYHQSEKIMTITVSILAILSVIGGAAGIFITKVLEHPPLSHDFVEHHHGLNIPILIISAVGGSLAVLLIYLLYGPKQSMRASLAHQSGRASLTKAIKPLVVLSERKFFIDEIYEYLFVLPLKMGAFLICYLFDIIFIDGLLVNGTSGLFYKISGAVRKMHTGAINISLLVILLGTIALVAYLNLVIFGLLK